MAKKKEFPQETIDMIIELYEQSNNYSKVSRESGLTIGMVKRILLENSIIDHKDTNKLICNDIGAPAEPNAPEWSDIKEELNDLLKTAVEYNGKF